MAHSTSTTTTCSTNSVTLAGTANTALAVNPSNILNQLSGRCSFSTNWLPAEVIAIFFQQIVAEGDIQSFSALSCTDIRSFKTGKEQFLKEKNIVQFFCPKINILDAKAQGLDIVEPPISFELLSKYPKLASRVEYNTSLTLFTVIENITPKQLIARLQKAGVEVKMEENDKVLNQYGDEAVKKTYRVLLSNGPVINSQNKPITDIEKENGEMVKGKESVVCEAGFDGFPTLTEGLLIVSLYAEKLFTGHIPPEVMLFSSFPEHTSLMMGFPLVVGGSALSPVFIQCRIATPGFSGGYGRKK